MSFEQRWRSFFNQVIKSNNGPLGEVIHYYWRLEIQARGAPHIHMKLWIKDAPIIGVNSEEEILGFIRKHISCSLAEDNPELNELVLRFQSHKCTKSCMRVFFRGKKAFTKCRYGFPRAANNVMSLNPLAKSVRSRQKSRHVIKIYNLERSPEETLINDYNPVILLLWRANMDIQFLGEKSMVLNRYITTYITKAEKNSTQAVWDDLNKTNSLHSALKSFALLSFKNREAGAVEVAYKLLGYSLCEADCKVEWLSTNMKNERNRRLKEKKDIECLPEDSTSIYHNNMLDNYYPNRPDNLEKMCLYDLATNYDYKTTPCNIATGHHDQCLTLKQKYGYLHKRKEPQLIKTYRYKPFNPEVKEKYFHQMLILFKPWRNEDVDLLDGTVSYAEAFSNSIQNKQIDEKIFEYEDQYKRIEEANEYAEKLLEVVDDDESNSDHSIENEEEEQLDLNLDYKST